MAWANKLKTDTGFSNPVVICTLQGKAAQRYAQTVNLRTHEISRKNTNDLKLNSSGGGIGFDLCVVTNTKSGGFGKGEMLVGCGKYRQGLHLEYTGVVQRRGAG
jgi:hypothetical protein